MLIKADFHIHSTVSPCAELEMSPKNIAKTAKEMGLDLIAIADHNTTLNCPAFKHACDEVDIKCLFGIEIESIEEVHILCLFNSLKTAEYIGKYVYERLQTIAHNPTIFGDQVYVNEKEEILGNVEKYLGAATNMTLDEIVDLGHKNNGLVIPSHVDKASFSLTSQLGFIPENDFDAIEIYRSDKARKDIKTQLPIISNSDAHFLEDIGGTYNQLDIKQFNISSLKDALSNNTIYTK